MAGRKLRYNEKTLDVLRALRHLNKTERIKILRSGHKQLIRCICDCVLNILKGNVAVTDKQKQKLKRHQKILRKLGTEQGNWSDKKKIIVQSGGGFILPLLAPLIGTLFAKIFE